MTPDAQQALQDALRRLEHLYEVSKLFTRFESIEETFDTALGLVTETLPLQSAILVEQGSAAARMIVWPSTGRSAEAMAAARAHAEQAVAYLTGDARPLETQEGASALAGQSQQGTGARYLVIPLSAAPRQVFGALQVECVAPPSERDLVFVNALANQLAIAVDRRRAWRDDVARREQAEAATLARDRILATVSHDLRSPLSTIVMAVQTTTRALQSLPHVDSRRLEDLRRIDRAARRMQRLIEDLLDYGSIERGHLELKTHPEDVAALLDDLRAGFDEALAAQKIQLHLERPAELPRLVCDRDRVLQILGNLLSNAVKFTPAGGAITVRIAVLAAALRFTVTDTGPGISDETLRRLFQRYARGPEAHYKGSGLGLAIAKGLVEAQGGQIWVESPPGKGATFAFTLPLADGA